MPSPRAIVAMRVQAEARLAQDVSMLAEVMGMPPEQVPQLLQPRVPHNDPNFKHVKFLGGVATLIESFLDHAGVDHEARRATVMEEQEQMAAEHQRIQVNPDSGVPGISPGDPRLTGVGQGLVDQSKVPVGGVVPGMLEGDIDDVEEAVSELDANDLKLLMDMERTRLGGPRASVMEVLLDRRSLLRVAAGQNAGASNDDQAAMADRQREAEESAARAAEAAAATMPAADASGAAVVSMAPGRQMAPERPPAAVRQRRGAKGATRSRSRKK